ncbi:MAG: HAMP domain-containing sensor histidine kinase [Acetobacter papayae]|uniref:sensor histidine kinase n=1 Tax=Acetobacter papayae TaxID=1076592 RepID=UPI0039ED7437
MHKKQGASPYPFSVFRSSSFRIMAMFAGCFVVCGITVMAVSGYHSLHLLRQQLQKVISNERDEALSDAVIHDIPHLRPVMTELVRNEPGFYYLLQDTQKHIVVGNMLPLRSQTGWRTLSWTHRSLPRDHRPVIGYGVLLDDGGYLFVGIDAEPVQTLRRDLWFTLAWNAAGFIVIGFAGGFIVSRLVLNKIETISQTARDIMKGSISRRLTLNTTNDEFEHLAASLNAMLDKNERLIESIRQVTDDIAHDMRRPLAHLGQHLDEIAHEGLSHSQQHTLSLAKVNLDEALEIFSTLLKIAQIESGEGIPDTQDIVLDEMLHSVTELYRPITEERGQKLILRLDRKALPLSGNRVLLMQMLANIMENATNHCPRGSTITVSSGMAGNAVMIAVADDGPGIPPQERERVFEKMVRLDRSRSIPGTGLGLSMVRAVVRLHQGTVRLLDNEPGVRCEIRLPKAGRKLTRDVPPPVLRVQATGNAGT